MANWGQAASGAAGGAVTGATLGSFFPVVGTAIGAGLGAAAGGTAGLLSKKPKSFRETPNKFSPEGQEALKMLLQRGQAGLKDPYQGWDPIEKRAQNRFQSQSLPGLAERFTSMGGSDTRGSSDLLGQLSGAQSDFDLGLEGLRTQYGQQNEQNSLQMLLQGLQPQTEQMYMGEQQGTGDQIAQLGGNALMSYLGGGGDFGFGQSSNGGQSNEQIPGQNVVGSYSKWNPSQKNAFAKFIQSLQGAM